MWFLLLCLVARSADLSEAERTQQYWGSLKHLQVHPDLIRPVEHPITWTEGPAEITLKSGYLVPVLSGRFSTEWERKAKELAKQFEAGEQVLPSKEERGSKAFVGFVWIGGSGTISVSLSDRADGIRLANRLAQTPYKRDDLPALAHGDVPLTASVSEGLIVGVDDRLEDAFFGPDSAGARDLFEVTIYGESDALKQARKQAQQVFRQRLKLYQTGTGLGPRLESQEPALGLELSAWVAWDRVAEDRRAASPRGQHLVADFHTDVRVGRASRLGGDIDRDKWLALVRDTSGGWDARRRVQVASIGRAANGQVVAGLLGGEVFPPSDPDDPRSAPAPVVRLDPKRALSQIYVQQAGSNLTLNVEVRTTLELGVIGGPINWFDMDIPRVEADDGSFELVELTLEDGTPLIGDAALVSRLGPSEQQRQREREEEEKKRKEEEERKKRGDSGKDEDRKGDGTDNDIDSTPLPEIFELPSFRVRLILPQSAKTGDTLKVKLHYKDTWPYTDQTTGLQGYLPSVGGLVGAPWRIRTDVAVPADGPLVVSASGDTEKEWDEAGWHLVRSVSRDRAALWADVAVGKWDSHDEPAQKGMPRVRVHIGRTYKGTKENFGPQTRQMINFYQGYLPAYPWPEFEIFEGPRGYGGLTWVAPHAMVKLQRALVSSEAGSVHWDKPHFSAGIYAHEVAHQWFGHLVIPATREDFWIAESLAETFSCLYLAAAYGPKDCDTRMQDWHQTWEARARSRTVHPSLTLAYNDPYQASIVYEYGPYVMLKMLHHRIGSQAMFGAFDLLAQDHAHKPVTTETVQHYLQQASGRDLGDFFDYWVYGGFVPAIDVEWWADKKGQIRGTVKSDVPFGTFDVPVVVHGSDKSTPPEVLWVEVVDGEGSFVSQRTDGARVELDPAGMVLAKRRRVQRRK